MQAYFEPEQAFSVSMHRLFSKFWLLKKNMYINCLCISHVLFVDIFTRSFDDFISIKFLIAVFFASLPVYCTLLVYYFGRNLPASPFISPFPSVWNSRVNLLALLHVHQKIVKIDIHKIANGFIFRKDWKRYRKRFNFYNKFCHIGIDLVLDSDGNLK